MQFKFDLLCCRYFSKYTKVRPSSTQLTPRTIKTDSEGGKQTPLVFLCVLLELSTLFLHKRRPRLEGFLLLAE